jgi:Uncharacterised nucleotidyltransferase
MSDRRASELAAAMTERIRSWPLERAAGHGFELMVDDEHAAARRRAQARTVLLAEHVLAGTAELTGGRVVVMKGVEVAQLYPAIVHRPFRDVDLLVDDARTLWDRYVERGYRSRPSRRADIDHHHLPALVAPVGRIGLEIHLRPNTPGWAEIDPAWVIETAEPSRTGIGGVWRPRDDVHAVLLALHAWKGGFTRQRDLYDAVLLAAASEIPVERTAGQLGLGRCWAWTLRFAEALILDRADRRTRAMASALLPHRAGVTDRKRVRLVAPYLVAGPVRVTRGHLAERRLGKEARGDGASSVSPPAL